MTPNVTIIIGAQWGDEGKGKWVDILSESADVIARFQGGNNAGHTLYVEGEKIVLHQIPSGIFQDQKTCVLAAGVVVNPSELVSEVEKLSHLVDVHPDLLKLSARANVITPWHVHLDGLNEKSRENPIGTTKRGIGPTYAAKAARVGLRLGQYIDPHKRHNWITMMQQQHQEFAEFYRSNRELWQEFEDAANHLAPYVCDAESYLRRRIKADDQILLEGAQGALLDLDHGTYPFVTSSSTAAGGACASIGFSPKHVKTIFGVAKAYITRVGAGPCPTELDDENGKKLAELGHEFGATTGRPRRCGWLDLVALRYAVEVNGLDGLILNKMDILSQFETIKLALAYQHPRLGRIDTFPWDAEILAECKPVYESFSGWNTEIAESSFEKLPAQAKAYISAIEESVNCPVTMIGTGVNRSDALFK